MVELIVTFTRSKLIFRSVEVAMACGDDMDTNYHIWINNKLYFSRVKNRFSGTWVERWHTKFSENVSKRAI